MKITKKISKYYEFALSKLKVLMEQKKFVTDDVLLKYIYKKEKDANALVVVFSACTREGIAARYNYIRSLNKVKADRLYILDDFGPDGRGSYYLGHMPEFKEQEAVITLINDIRKNKMYEKVIFCGSCKGGYAALNIGTQFKDSIMVVGEPTYKIASEFKLAENLMKYWMGEVTEENIDIIDNHLTKRLRDNEYKRSQKIYLFYSAKDEYVERHTQPLLRDLKEFGYDLSEETSDFKVHADLGLYFVRFLKQNVSEILDDKKFQGV